MKIVPWLVARVICYIIIMNSNHSRLDKRPNSLYSRTWRYSKIPWISSSPDLISSYTSLIPNNSFWNVSFFNAQWLISAFDFFYLFQISLCWPTSLHFISARTYAPSSVIPKIFCIFFRCLFTVFIVKRCFWTHERNCKANTNLCRQHFALHYVNLLE